MVGANASELYRFQIHDEWEIEVERVRKIYRTFLSIQHLLFSHEAFSYGDRTVERRKWCEMELALSNSLKLLGRTIEFVFWDQILDQ